MLVPDVNVLLYAHRREPPEHDAYAAWLRALVGSVEPFGLSELASSAFVRIVTNPRAFDPPTPADLALAFIEALRTRPNCRSLRPGARNWPIFQHLCESTQVRGKLIADAYHAALAIEHGCVLATADGDFSRFTALRWVHPLRPAS